MVIFIGCQISFALGSCHNNFNNILRELASDNWVRAKNAAEKIKVQKIYESENQLIMLLDERKNVSLLEEVIDALIALKSVKAFPAYIPASDGIEN